MATIKAYTDLEQSKKLAKILPLESADAVYPWRELMKDYDSIYVPETMLTVDIEEDDILAWSLAALLSVLPEIQGSKPIIALDDNYITYPHMSDLHTKADNLVDACVAMIEKLHELNLL